MSENEKTSLLSATNELQVRLFFAAAAIGAVFLIISIIATTPNYRGGTVIALGVLAVVLAIIAILWPLMRQRLAISNLGTQLATSLSQISTSGAAWFALVILIGGIATGLSVYNRSVLPPPPVLVGLRYTQDRIPSTKPNLPYGLEIVIQTDKTITLSRAVFVFDGDVGEGNLTIASVGMFVGGFCVPKEHPNVFLIQIERPEIQPQTPVIVHVYSKTAIKVTKFITE